MSRRQAFTFAELMISTAIFATVLLMAFTTIAAVNRLQRQARSVRAFAGTSQSVYQTVTQLARYAQKPASPLAICSISTPQNISAALVDGVTVQDSGRRLWLVAPDLTAAGQYRVFLFAALLPDASARYHLYSASFKATTTTCASDLTAADMMAGSNLLLRLNPTDPPLFAVGSPVGVGVQGVPNSAALLAEDAWGSPWMLSIKMNVVTADGSGSALPIYSRVTSRTPQQVITAP